ncbi:hypothetical protein BT93_D0853 [Corymbia citriodora subsp. variegata]|nr:hypothetical protein BT93_D0853 [Corymbia citriodora subsp. variegata]
MASPGNPNQPSPPPPSFDMAKFLMPPTSPSQPQSHIPYPPPPTSSSYPPPALGPAHFNYAPAHTSPFTHQDHLLSQRSLSYPTPLLQPPSPNAGAHLMALLSPFPQPSLGPSEIPAPSSGSTPGVPARMPSSKVPRGRPLEGDCVVYDVDDRWAGEVQPQLEVTPITKYASDPQLVLGRQIAVNQSYICYGLKQGNIRVLNINTASRSLLRGHTQRITDMVFFAEDVHLLASASTDGRIYVWKVSESLEEDTKQQIIGNIVIAIQLTGEKSVHPRVCWHCHKQEILVVGIGERVLRIDTTKVGKGEHYSAEEPLMCPVNSLIEGIQFVGKHDGEVTDLSMCQWMTSRLVSSSVDGTIKIWEDRKTQPLAVLRPYDGHPVSSAAFVTSPYRPDHIILITAGPLNRELKVWASASEEGWLLPSHDELWKCTQTLDLRSSSEPHVQDAFFNQVLVLPQAGLLLLANAKKNAIYAVHLEYGPNPTSTRMDYLAEFTVTMPILSFTGVSDTSPYREHVIQVYCVQTQAIQQYALDLHLCLPPLEKMGLEKSDPDVSCDAMNVEGLTAADASEIKPTEFPSAASAPKITERTSSPDVTETVRFPISSASVEMTAPQAVTSFDDDSRTINVAPPTSQPDSHVVAPAPLPPLSPRLSPKISGFRSPSGGSDSGLPFNNHTGNEQVMNSSADRQVESVPAQISDVALTKDESRNDEKKVSQDNASSMLNHPVAFTQPTHLITPSEILRAVSSSETSFLGGKSEEEANAQDVVVNSEAGNTPEEIKVVADTGFTQEDEFSPEEQTQDFVAESRERIFSSQISDLGLEMARESRDLSQTLAEANPVAGCGLMEPPGSGDVEEIHDSSKYVCEKVSEPGMAATVIPGPISNGKSKKQKGRNSQVSGPSSSSPSASNSTDSYNEAVASSSLPSMEAAFPQIVAMQDKLNQLMNMQKEMKKQMTATVNMPITKEGRRLEASLGRSMEKTVKANNEAFWARFQEESFKNEKLVQDRMQQITNLLNNLLNWDMPAIVKKELATVQASVVRAIMPAVEKTVSSAITESFQRGVGDKAVSQLEKSVNSKLEATVTRQILAQFQTSGRQAIQDALKSTLEASVIPAFEMSCKAMFEQVDATFQKGIVEHSTAAQQHLESVHSPLALALRDAINSASSMTRSLSGDLAETQRKLLALAVAGVNSPVNLLATELSNGPLGGLQEKVDKPFDPTKELSRLISELKYEEAFTLALQRSDVSFVSWLCSQVNLHRILTITPLPLSQGVLLSLLQQLACDINKDTPRKLSWMTDVAGAINPSDPLIAVHVRPIFEQVYQILSHQRTLPTNASPELSSIRLLMHVINSMLMTSK